MLGLAPETKDAREQPDKGSAGLGAGGGIERVVLRFEGTVPASVTALAESDLRTAFGRRGVEVVRRDGGPSNSGSTAGAVVLTIAIASERLDQVALKIEEKAGVARGPVPALADKVAPPASSTSATTLRNDGGGTAFTLARRLDLNAFPPDGRMLALVVAADEMLVAAGTEHQRRLRGAAGGGAEPALPGAVEAEAPPPATPAAPNAVAAAAQPEVTREPPAEPVSAPAEVAQARAPGETRDGLVPWGKDGLAATFAFDRFGGGQTHLGVDVAWRRRLGSRWLASLAVQGRRGLTVTTGAGTVDSRLLGGRIALGRTLASDGGRLWLTADVGARAGLLQYEGRGTGPGGDARQVDTFFGYLDATLALDVRLGRSPLAVRLGAGAGLPLVAQDAASSDTVVTGASGAAFEAQAGVVLTF